MDKNACCAYQTFKNVLELKIKVKALEEMMNKESEVVQYKTIDDLDEVEQVNG